ncbi:MULTISPECIES: DUF4189 domain-containing protein [Xanthomonas]|uniref:DUF4189 domain-containing protein n=1 Tax=Xanthomonas TaxID=338 RepID=UPI000BAA9746|nr:MULTISPECIES: DUF4189 domain-containing protein [Xanthomonas]ASW45329.1 hypothetical protein XJ27_04560 [Xanthomonas hortorum]MCE4280336.1 DUF4189 domain-containing protein [Xanthomonas hortorum pv. vitians]MCE4337714.1 DUF4189 domain-containing protein [Xanthomonas hortorum pv. vitians]MCE4507163.1 DUF4189 domain-containing protein [Xanthomonas hortorum pv. vitians]WJM75506.1 DUF4189 domain-containing protein [Xanthomonas hortorum pv. vitians]
MRFNRFALLFLMIVGIPAMAEQGCPPGQYPIGGQGVAACAPIPQGSSQETAPAPRPLGKWIKTWGAVALDGEGTVGVDYGKLSKREAQKGAIASCVKAGGKECRDWATYHNQCAAVAEPYKDGISVAGKLQFVGNAELEEAKAEAEKKCNSVNNNSCRVIYSNCTEQIFEKF